MVFTAYGNTRSRGSFSVVEDGVYLICAEEDEVKIRLSEEEEKQLFYYED